MRFSSLLPPPEGIQLFGFAIADLHSSHACFYSMHMLTGINHLTIAVTDLQSSITFYKDALGMRLKASWDAGAYLCVGDLWVCLSLDPSRNGMQADYTHYAFSVAQNAFSDFKVHLEGKGVMAWRDNASEGDSFYFLDPDGHKLEIHVGNLESRLEACRSAPYSGMKFYE